jgi:hypothetical protein
MEAGLFIGAEGATPTNPLWLGVAVGNTPNHQIGSGVIAAGNTPTHSATRRTPAQFQ